ncbi:DUF58 domain-containing protein [Pseudohongiella spirulinae]|uniref:Uncharacterized protein n=1 Tax=Pseudohongiella spirulinae TaxID=1249552 RepID=A0A0S2KB44_9GAMM|nr:DUF58 domain-containing protein [Pseudohongiella spirulinae]ALO45564.1 hypothetical protein PS2015_894 [Pseudohongiella spirulinae]
MSYLAVQTQIRHYAERLRTHFPLSMAGLLILLLALASLQGFGYQRMDLVVFALTVCALSIVLISSIMVITTGLIIRKRLRLALNSAQAPLKAEASYPNDTQFMIPGHSWLPMMTLEWRVVAPDAMHTRIRFNTDEDLLEETIVPEQRCLGGHITRLFTVRDVMGLCRFSWRMSQAAQIMILPKIGQLRALPLLRSMDAEDGIPDFRGAPQGDRMDIRRYAPGDSVRDIMWRVYARNRHLNVRLPEKSMFQSERTLAYLVSGPADEAAAGVARFAVAEGALGEPWLFSADGSSDVARTTASALPLIAGSRQPGRTLEFGLDAFLQQQGGQYSACIVFVPATKGSWTRSLLETLARFPGPFTIVIGIDGSTESSSPPHYWQRMLFSADKQASRSAAADLRELIALFGKVGTQVLVVDRQSGQCFDHRLKRV